MQEGAQDGIQPADWKYNPGQAAPAVGDVVQWTASEYIAHHKSAVWYGVLAGTGVIVAVLVYLLTRDVVSTGVIVLAAALIGIMGAKKPRVLNYKLDQKGLDIEGKFYPYSVFRSFSPIDEHIVGSVGLMPLHRFKPLLTIYFDPADEDKIMDVLTDHLPLEHRELDPVDRFMSKIRF